MMTTDNKQYVPSDAKRIAHQLWDDAIASDYQGFEAKVLEALSKLRGADEPSDKEIESLALDCGFNKSNEHWGDRYYTELGTHLFGFARALLARYALTSGHSTRSPDTSSGHSDPVAWQYFSIVDQAWCHCDPERVEALRKAGMQIRSLSAAPQASAEKVVIENVIQNHGVSLQTYNSIYDKALEAAAGMVGGTNWLADDGDVPALIAKHIRGMKSAPAAEPETLEEILRHERERAPMVLPKDPTLPDDTAKGAGDDFPSDLPGRLREYASNNGYSHQDYADTMRKAADALDRQQRGGDVLIPVEPTHAILTALSGEWHSSKHGKVRERYAAMIAAVNGEPNE